MTRDPAAWVEIYEVVRAASALAGWAILLGVALPCAAAGAWGRRGK